MWHVKDSKYFAWNQGISNHWKNFRFATEGHSLRSLPFHIIIVDGFIQVQWTQL